MAQPEYDLVIRNGFVVDGTGRPGFDGDVGVRDGRIVAVGDVPGRAATTIDASGQVISPGFVDIHTHYDVQLFWDPFLTVSPMHGVTTVLSANCGFGVAPTRAEHRELLLKTLENVEGMPFECTSAGLGEQWPFETFPEYLDAVERRGTAVNMGFYIGHTPVRTWVMGTDAAKRPATEEEIAKMKALVAQGIAAGAWGFSTSVHPSHTGYLGLPVPSRLATVDEIITLVSALQDAGRGIFQSNRGATVNFETLELLMQRTGRPVSLSGVTTDEGGAGGHRDIIRGVEELSEKGYPITVQMSALPLQVEFNLRNPYQLATNFPAVFENTPLLDDLLAPVLSSKDPAVARQVYQDPNLRKRLVERTSGAGWDAMFHRMSVCEYPGRPNLIGQDLTILAAESGRHPMETLLDLALESDLEVTFTFLSTNADDAELEKLLRHPLTRLGLTDGGAHVAQICDARYPTLLLRKWVREKGTLSLERAVQQLSSETADVAGFRDRGRLQSGMAADIVVFNADTVDAGPLRRVADLPAGATRLLSEAVGMSWVVVNGVPIYDHGQQMIAADAEAGPGAGLPGHVLRSS
jgi:N-acyl-D-amino-acid deacylase